MIALLASTGSLVLVNLVCACVALAVGFATGVWFFGSTGTRKPAPARVPKQLEEKLLKANERAMMASSRLKDLASGIASDVHSHSAVVEELNDTLNTVTDANDDAIDATVFKAIANMVEANSTLQEKLADAEKQIEAQAAEIESHETEARTDSLTELANRRAFDDELTRRYAEWERKDTPVSLLLMDIDHFKIFNDTHGHQAGDEVLRQVGRTLDSATRDMDIPCRYGGEEFAVIMPATVADEASIVAERIRVAIEEMTIHFEGKVLTVTTSVGLAQVAEPDDIKRLLKRADDALYRSKATGRNCGHLHDGENCVPITPGIAVPQTGTLDPEQSKPLTKVLDSLPDTEAFGCELTRRVSESHRFGVPLSVIHLEVDQYEAIRRDFGAAAAELTLDSVAQFINTTLRDMDLLARAGEGDFLVMLPGSSKLEAWQVGRRVEASMAGCVIPAGGKRIRLSVRYGIAVTVEEDTADSIVERARLAIDDPSLMEEEEPAPA